MFFLWYCLIDSTIQQHDIALYLSQDPVALFDILSDPFVLCYTHYFFSQNNFSQQQDYHLVDNLKSIFVLKSPVESLSITNHIRQNVTFDDNLPSGLRPPQMEQLSNSWVCSRRKYKIFLGKLTRKRHVLPRTIDDWGVQYPLITDATFTKIVNWILGREK